MDLIKTYQNFQTLKIKIKFEFCFFFLGKTLVYLIFFSYLNVIFTKFLKFSFDF